MNILILNYEYPPLGGGAGIVTQHLAEEFIAKGHQVSVLTTWFSGEPEYHSYNNLTIIRLKAKRANTYQSNPFEMYDWMRKAKQYVKAHLHDFTFDICLANFTLPGGAVAHYLKKKINLPYVILSHGHDIPWFSPSQMFFWHLLCFPIIKKIMQDADATVVLTEQLQQTAQAFIGEKNKHKIQIIPNGLLAFSIKKGFDARDKIIQAVFVGRLVEQKDPFAVIRACKILQQQGIPIHLQLIGDGILKRDLEKYIAKHQLNQIDVLGKISQSSVLEVFEKAHILIAPSREEAMSLSILEAISCGVYVFATNVSGTKDLILNDMNGNFVEYGNAEDIAQKISTFYHQKFLKNYHYPEMMLQYIQQNYTWETSANKYLTLFEAIVHTKPK
ncbi:MAG: glycosyltransferase family 4 protein [Bacteroidetes bacterium]|nr:glycosyltransferase family 4 protein [Bacteroidota bacterium]